MVTAISERPLDWALLRGRMDTSYRSDAGRMVGRWMFDVLENDLGADWLKRAARGDPGAIRALTLAQGHQVAFAESLELALRLRILSSLPGMVRVRKDLSGDARHSRLIHSRMQLELASLAGTTEFDVSVESRTRPGAARTVDVRVDTPDGVVAAETFAVLTDKSMRDGTEFWDSISLGLMRVRIGYDVEFSGAIRKRLSGSDVAQLLALVENAASQVAADGSLRTVTFKGAELTVTPGHAASGATLTGPAERSRGWPRFRELLDKKKRQTRESGANWLVANMHDGLWQFTPWAHQPLGAKASSLAELATTELGDAAWLDGIVLSSGLLLAQGTFVGESCKTEMGAYGLRRIVEPLRVRETVVVPLTDRGASLAPHLVHLYDAEPGWLAWALAQVGLPGPDEALAFVPFP